MTVHAAPAPALYDQLAGVYDRWLSGDEMAEPCLRFYVNELRDEGGPVLELGVGTGRISRRLAAAGRRVVGLDLSLAMLAQADAGPAVCGRFEALPFGSGGFAAVILPMRTIGHLTEPSALHATLTEVARVLRPDGRFLFDHYQLDRAWAEAHDGRPRLMYAGPVVDAEDAATLIWDRYDYAFVARRLHCTVRVDEVGPGPTSRRSSTVEFDFRWFEAGEIRTHAAEAGLAVEACYGDFDRAPFTERADHMIFEMRRR